MLAHSRATLTDVYYFCYSKSAHLFFNMCLTIPKQVIAVFRGRAKVQSPNGEQNVSALVKVKKGDWVLTQNNVIVSKISYQEVKELKNLLKGGKKT